MFKKLLEEFVQGTVFTYSQLKLLIGTLISAVVF